MSKECTHPAIQPAIGICPRPEPNVGPSWAKRRRLARLLHPFQIDVRSLAAMRIVLGLTLTYELIYRMQLVGIYYTAAGASPLRAQGVSLSDLTLFALDGSYAWAMTLVVTQLVCAVLFTVGYRTRLMTIANAGLLYSLVTRNAIIAHAGMNLALWLLIWSIFLPLGASASLDARLARYDRHVARFRRACSIATLAALWQMVFVYWSAVSAKNDDVWRTQFTALYFYLNSHLSTPLGYLLASHMGATRVLTMMTMAFEAILPAIAMLTFALPRARTVAVFAFIAFHLGILATVYVGTFSFFCIAGWLLFLPSDFWDALLRQRIGRYAATAWCKSCATIADASGRLSMGRRGAQSLPDASAINRRVHGLHLGRFSTAVLTMLFAYACVVNAAYDLPTSLTRHANFLLHLPQLKQNWAVMASKISAFNRLAIDVTLADGTRHRLTADEPSVDGAFWWTLPRAGISRQSYFRPRFIPLESAVLVSFRGTLLNQAMLGNRDGVTDFCAFHRRCWDEHHPDPRQKIVRLDAKHVYDVIADPDDLFAKPIPPGEVLIYSWPDDSKSVWGAIQHVAH